MPKEQSSLWRIAFEQNFRGKIECEFIERFGFIGEVEERGRVLEYQRINNQHNRRFETEVQTVTKSKDKIMQVKENSYN
jgi:hypothetical protein